MGKIITLTMEAPPEDTATSIKTHSELVQFGQCKIEKVECKEEEEKPESSLNTSQHDSRTSSHQECQDSDDESSWSAKDQARNAIEVKEEEEPVRRGLRPREKKQRSPEKVRPKKNKAKKKQKRQRKELEKDDPRNRGVPKQKKIRKRRNKPKVVSEQAKRDAEVKREQQEHMRMINKRGKKPVIKKIRGEKKRLERKGQEIIKLEEGNVKLQDSDSSSQSDDEHDGIKRRTSRLQKKRERDEDKRKVDGLMVLRGERERREQLEALVRMQRLMAAKFGTKLLIKIDPSCKYYSQYKCRKDEIEKSGKLYSQIYNSHPVPSTGMHFFQLKIARLSFQSVTVGLITSRNFHQQYSRDKSHCICFDAYTHSTYVEGAKTDLQVEVKLNDVIRTVVDIPNATVHWYVNQDFISEAIIPPHMAAMPLYPYLQVSNKWIKLRINDFQE